MIGEKSEIHGYTRRDRIFSLNSPNVFPMLHAFTWYALYVTIWILWNVFPMLHALCKMHHETCPVPVVCRRGRYLWRTVGGRRSLRPTRGWEGWGRECSASVTSSFLPKSSLAATTSSQRMYVGGLMALNQWHSWLYLILLDILLEILLDANTIRVS